MTAQNMHGKCIWIQDMLGTHKEHAKNIWNTKQITSLCNTKIFLTIMWQEPIIIRAKNKINLQTHHHNGNKKNRQY